MTSLQLALLILIILFIIVVISIATSSAQSPNDGTDVDDEDEGEPQPLPCTYDEDCPGFIPQQAGTPACCDGICQNQLADWSGTGYCPSVCQDAPSPLGKPGTCNSGYHWPREEGEPCDTNFACAGFVAGQPNTLACCNNTCTPQKEDWAGIGYCPNECRGCPDCQPGSCT